VHHRWDEALHVIRHSLSLSPAPFRITDVVAVPAVAVGGGEPVEAVSVGLVPEGPAFPVVWGDCIAGLPVGSAGRAPAFQAARGLATIERVVAPALQGREVRRFRDAAAWLEAMCEWIE